jgi:hypothetical protein
METNLCMNSIGFRFEHLLLAQLLVKSVMMINNSNTKVILRTIHKFQHIQTILQDKTHDNTVSVFYKDLAQVLIVLIIYFSINVQN